MLDCCQKCIVFLNELQRKKASILFDAEGKVLREYRNAFRLSTYPNNATMFLIYAQQNAEYMELSEKNGYYDPYPADKELKSFDPSDLKFIAMAYQHVSHPPIIEASDSKWWGIKEKLEENGIKVIFIDEEYISNKYRKKMEK